MATRDVPRKFKAGYGRGKTQPASGTLAGAGVEATVARVPPRERDGEHDHELRVPQEGVGDLEGTNAEELALPKPSVRPLPELLQVGARVSNPCRYSEIEIAKPQRQA